MLTWIRQLLCSHNDRLIQEYPDGSRLIECVRCEKTLARTGARWTSTACTQCGDSGRELFPATFVERVPGREPVPHPGWFCSYFCYDRFASRIELQTDVQTSSE